MHHEANHAFIDFLVFFQAAVIVGAVHAVDVGRVAATEVLQLAHGHAAAQAFLADYLVEGELVAVDVLHGEVAYAERLVFNIGDYAGAPLFDLCIVFIDIAVDLHIEINSRAQLFPAPDAEVGRGDDHQHHPIFGKVSVFRVAGVREHHARLEAQDICIKGDCLLHVPDRQRGG